MKTKKFERSEKISYSGKQDDIVKKWRTYKKTHSLALREELILRYLYLVKYVAGRVAISLPPNVEFGDLVSYGILGLFDAIEKYDPEHGNKFETYGVSRIRGTIMDELRKLDWAPRLLRKRARELDRKVQLLGERLGREPTDDELAKAMCISRGSLRRLHSDLSSTTFLSLDEVWQNDDGNKPISRLQTIEDSVVNNQFMFVHKNEIKDLLAKAIDELPDKEKLVIILYYYENLTLKEIGAVLNVSESRVCQIHTKVILRLRGMLKRIGEYAFEI